MIKANEYSIGNHITYLDEIYVVNGITYEELNPDKWRIHFRTLNGSSSNAKSLSWINPIPLTPEWLERCGFVNKHEATTEGPLIYSILKMDLDIAKEEDGYYLRYECQDSYYDCNIGVQMLHLHQLQNLYYSLTGEELNVKL